MLLSRPECRIVAAECRAGLRQLADCAAQMCVTSPPYFGLRDYGTPPQEWAEIEYAPMPGLPPVTIPAQTVSLGGEADPLAFIGHLVAVFREVHRVLADDGVLWLNLGDSYAAGKMGRADYGTDDATSTLGPKRAGLPNNTRPGPTMARKAPQDYKPKDLLGIPWRAAYALQADGWYLRSDVIWHKPNPMPESVTDRPTKAHEYLFMLTKSARYFYDADAISENALTTAPKKEPTRGLGYGAAKGVNGKMHDRDGGFAAKEGSRNRRSVWTVATTPYSGAHFAVFPPALIEPCILATSRPMRVIDGFVHDLVIDPFTGSGTTAEVALTHGRSFFGCELSEAYAPLYRKRVERLGVECKH